MNEILITYILYILLIYKILANIHRFQRKVELADKFQRKLPNIRFKINPLNNYEFVEEVLGLSTHKDKGNTILQNV
jgi:hypothetical protein